jgi:hypothetical protein
MPPGRGPAARFRLSTHMKRKDYHNMQGEGAGRYRRFLDPANVILTIAVAVALGFMVYMSKKIIVISQENERLSAEVAEFARLEVGDIVPALSAKDVAGAPARIEFKAG